MIRSVTRLLAVFFFIFLSSAASLTAQTPEQFTELAGKVVEIVAKSHGDHVLLAPRERCLFNVTVCAALDTELRTQLKAQIPNVQIMGPDAVAPHLAGARLLALDIYSEWVLLSLMDKTGSKILITEDLTWNPNGYQVMADVTNHGKQTSQTISANLTLTEPDISNKPLIYNDPDTGVALVLDKATNFGVNYPDGRHELTKAQGPVNHYPPSKLLAMRSAKELKFE